jgi:abequosyltransferase
MLHEASCKLSICITTFNRVAYIGATLESIIVQMTNDCEIVIVDGGSTDGTEQVVAEYVRRCDRLRYFRQSSNNGIDQDYDRALELSAGKYCWFMTDDDLLKPGAVMAVLRALRQDVSLIIGNVELSSVDMSRVLEHRWLRFDTDRDYRPDEMDRLFAEAGDLLKYIGSIVIRRSIWLARERQRYYGLLYLHVGVIFQKPLPGKALLIAEPLISYRCGNTHTYSPQGTELLFAKWPSLIASLAISENARRKVGSAEPWRSLRWLLALRGTGWYTRKEYARWIRPRLATIRERFAPAAVSMIPGVVVNTLLVLYYSIASCQLRGVWLHEMRESRFNVRNLRFAKRDT